jgi:hypothetical protein
VARKKEEHELKGAEAFVLVPEHATPAGWGGEEPEQPPIAFEFTPVEVDSPQATPPFASGSPLSQRWADAGACSLAG